MKIKTINKAMVLALLSLSLVACTSNNSQQTSPEVNTDQVENGDDNTNEIVEEAKADNDNDMENTDIKENKTDDDADKTTTIEVKKSDSKENKDKNTADKKESTDKKDSSKALDKNSKEKDGVYSSSLMSEKNGEREAELQTASVYDILAEEGKLTVKGSIDYQVDLNDYKNLEELENNRKIALLGINGSGKTTLINMIINKEVWVHPNLKIGYYSQLGERLNPLNSILENVLETSIYDQSITRIILARLGFKRNDVFKDINILSDGERAKVKLAKLITSDFNFIIMDEPTNFLNKLDIFDSYALNFNISTKSS